MNYSDEYINEVKKVILKNIPSDEYSVFLYGSRASKTNRRTSDIDVGIEGEKPIDKFIIYKILDELDDLPIPLRVDITDFHEVSEEFKKEAKKNIEIWK